MSGGGLLYVVLSVLSDKEIRNIPSGNCSQVEGEMQGRKLK